MRYGLLLFLCVESLQAQEPRAAVQPVTPLLAQQPAPFDGLLVPETTFQAYLEQQMRADRAEAMLKVRDGAVKQAADQLAECRGAQASWWAAHKFYVGVALGVAASGALVYEARQL